MEINIDINGEGIAENEGLLREKKVEEEKKRIIEEQFQIVESEQESKRK